LGKHDTIAVEAFGHVNH